MIDLTPNLFAALLATFLITVAIAAIASWRSGHASYLGSLKKKHFGVNGNEEVVARVLRHIAERISKQYQRRDNVHAAMRQVDTGDPCNLFMDLEEVRRKIYHEIEQLWRERHEAEATAKLIDLGDVVDKIHAEGIHGPERVETPQGGTATTM